MIVLIASYKGLSIILCKRVYTKLLTDPAQESFFLNPTGICLLNRKFEANSPNEKWLTDVTEFKYGNGRKAYLSAILDLHSNTIVSSVMGHSNNNKLVFTTLKKALKAAPGDKPMLHSDRGFQYTSKAFKRKLDKAKMTQSMSRVGRCIDNGPIEAFWGTLKCEMYHLNTYSTFK